MRYADKVNAGARPLYSTIYAHIQSVKPIRPKALCVQAAKSGW